MLGTIPEYIVWLNVPVPISSSGRQYRVDDKDSINIIDILFLEYKTNNF